jgi:hypothetical protein
MRLGVNCYEDPVCELCPLTLVFQINILILKNPSKMVSRECVRHRRVSGLGEDLWVGGIMNSIAGEIHCV